MKIVVNSSKLWLAGRKATATATARATAAAAATIGIYTALEVAARAQIPHTIKANSTHFSGGA